MMWMMKDGRRVPWSDREGMEERREALSDLKGNYNFDFLTKKGAKARGAKRGTKGRSRHKGNG